MTDRKVKAYKRKFDRDLRHIKVLFMKNKAVMSHQQWVDFIHETKASILENPEAFFSFELPPRKIMIEALELVFDGFFVDQKIRDTQQSKVVKNNK